MRTSYVAALAFTAVVALSSCATAPQALSTPEVACANPQYVQLQTVHPDSLGSRELTRFTELDTACQHERQLRAQHDRRRGMMDDSRWYWMPAMMLVGALMMRWWW